MEKLFSQFPLLDGSVFGGDRLLGGRTVASVVSGIEWESGTKLPFTDEQRSEMSDLSGIHLMWVARTPEAATCIDPDLPVREIFLPAGARIIHEDTATGRLLIIVRQPRMTPALFIAVCGVTFLIRVAAFFRCLGYDLSETWEAGLSFARAVFAGPVWTVLKAVLYVVICPVLIPVATYRNRSTTNLRRVAAIVRGKAPALGMRMSER